MKEPWRKTQKNAQKRENGLLFEKKNVSLQPILESEGAKEEIAVAVRLPEKTVYTINNNVRNRRD